MILFFKIFKFCYNYLFTLCGPVALGRFRMEAVCMCEWCWREKWIEGAEENDRTKQKDLS